MDWNCDLMLKLFIPWLNAPYTNNGFAWTVTPDDQDIALSAFHLDIFSLVEGQAKMWIF